MVVDARAGPESAHRVAGFCCSRGQSSEIKAVSERRQPRSRTNCPAGWGSSLWSLSCAVPLILWLKNGRRTKPTLSNQRVALVQRWRVRCSKPVAWRSRQRQANEDAGRQMISTKPQGDQLEDDGGSTTASTPSSNRCSRNVASATFRSRLLREATSWARRRKQSRERFVLAEMNGGQFGVFRSRANETAHRANETIQLPAPACKVGRASSPRVAFAKIRSHAEKAGLSVSRSLARFSIDGQLAETRDLANGVTRVFL